MAATTFKPTPGSFYKSNEIAVESENAILKNIAEVVSRCLISSKLSTLNVEQQKSIFDSLNIRRKKAECVENTWPVWTKIMWWWHGPKMRIFDIL